MKRKIFFILSLFSIFFIAVQSKLPSKIEEYKLINVPDSLKQVRIEPRTNNPFLKKALDQYETHFMKFMNKDKVPGAAIVVVKGDKIVYMKGVGVKEFGTTDSINENTVFRLASLSKGFAAGLVGTFVQEGVLDWDDKIVDFLPDFKLYREEQTKNLTIRHVLSQTTGLPKHAFTDILEDGSDFYEIISELKDVPLIGDVGQYYSYQNVIYSIVAEVIYQATGKSYSQAITQRFFKGLHMDDASCSYYDIISNDNVAQPHVRIGRKRWRKVSIDNKYYNAIPAGGINASISDMGQWLLALMGNNQDVLQEKTLNEIFTPHIRTFVRYKYFAQWRYAKKPCYGLGWRVLQNKNDTIVYHGGYVNGYKTEIAYNKQTNVGICVLFNGANPLSYRCIPDFFNYYDNLRDSIDYHESLSRELAIK